MSKRPCVCSCPHLAVVSCLPSALNTCFVGASSTSIPPEASMYALTFKVIGNGCQARSRFETRSHVSAVAEMWCCLFECKVQNYACDEAFPNNCHASNLKLYQERCHKMHFPGDLADLVMSWCGTETKHVNFTQMSLASEGHKQDARQPQHVHLNFR